ncbi:MAG: sigma 54-interacting transcriptional regulator [Myxococcaceae bacterium]
MAPSKKTLSGIDAGLGALTEGVLRVLDGPSKGQSLKLDGAVVVGSGSTGVDLRLDDQRVSRRHAEIRLGPFGFLVKDLGSRNGTWFSGSKVAEVMVPAGAVVKLGPVHLALDAHHDERRVRVLAPSLAPLAGRNTAMFNVLKLAQQAANADVPVLICGETGTGKGVLARAMHSASARSKGPLEVLDCAAVVSSLAQSEWFGHEQGAFTGAAKAHAGTFERADGGTVFLDELGELSPELQPALLRIVEQGEVQRLGSTELVKTDVRLIAATHRDLAAEVAAGRFREDLYYRLNVVPLRLPALRERLDDLPWLVGNQLKALGLKDPGSIAGPNLSKLEAHDWPGNLRELHNVLARAVVGAQPSARFSQLTLSFDTAAPQKEPAAAAGNAFQAGKQAAIARFEKQYLAQLLQSSGGKLKTASRESGIERTQLKRLLKKHGLL